MDNNKVMDRVFVRKEDREIYQRIRVHDGSLQGVENSDLFLMAIIFGFEEKGRDGLNEKIPNLSDGLIRTASFSGDTWEFIKAFSVYVEEDIDVLGDINRMLEIAQIYAFHGISILDKIYSKNASSFLGILEDLINDKFKEYELGI